MKTNLILFAATCVLTVFASAANAKPKVRVRTVYRRTESVDFDATDVNGVARSPDGAYVNQRRAVKFLPLYHVNLNFDHAIKNSVGYLK